MPSPAQPDWAAVRARVRRRHRAVDAVRQMGDGLTVEERAAALRRELERDGGLDESPSEAERLLVMHEREPADQIRASLRSMGPLASTFRKLLAGEPLPPGMPGVVSHPWHEVVLDAGTDAILDAVSDAPDTVAAADRRGFHLMLRRDGDDVHAAIDDEVVGRLADHILPDGVATLVVAARLMPGLGGRHLLDVQLPG